MRQIVVLVVIVLFASIFTATGIKATDYLTVAEGVCPVDMVAVDNVPGVLCVDRYEAAADTFCPHKMLFTPLNTKENIALETCVSTGSGEVPPWRFITREEASLVCARSGKRLPNAYEWYAIALPTNLSGCVFAGREPVVGEVNGCVTPAGVVHMPGNVWEWVSDDVFDSNFENRSLPESGYIAAVDRNGIATVTSTTSDSHFGADYTRFTAIGHYGMVRGGFYGSGDDGGLYALQANVAPTFASAGIGFRCVK